MERKGDLEGLFACSNSSATVRQRLAGNLEAGTNTMVDRCKRELGKVWWR